MDQFINDLGLSYRLFTFTLEVADDLHHHEGDFLILFVSDFDLLGIRL